MYEGELEKKIMGYDYNDAMVEFDQMSFIVQHSLPAVHILLP